MKQLILTLLASIGAGCLLAGPAAEAVTYPGVISYWGRSTYEFSRLPEGSIAILNPSSGIFDSSDQGMTVVPFAPDYGPVVKKAAARNVAILGYVPTGYFHHGCNVNGKCQAWNRIEAQVKTYFARFPQLAGIFFDEAAPSDWSCEAFGPEYERLRAIVKKYRPDARIAFNPGVADLCPVTAAQTGEILMLFETDGAAYRAQQPRVVEVTAAARARGVLSWHVINTVPDKQDMLDLVALARQSDPDYLYIVDVSGDWQAGYNTYGRLPKYWRDELQAIQGADTKEPQK